jgi:hypothetical protein
MHRTRSIAIAAVLFAAASARATTVTRMHPDDLVGNPTTYSSNHRFCFIERLDSRIPDFGTVRASSLHEFDEDGNRVDYDDESGPVVGVLYDERQAVALLPPSRQYDYVLVSDSGKFVVHVGDSPDDPFVTIDRSDGTPRIALHESDVLSASDRAALLGRYFYLHPRLEVVEDRELLVIPVPNTLHGDQPSSDVRVDLLTGARLDGLADLYPVLRAWPSPSDGVIPLDRRSKWESTKCGATLEREPIYVSSKQLYARAARRVLPAFPLIAGKARIAGTVWMDVTVDESGHVVCTRTLGLPFGITAAAENAMWQWTFEPYILDGKAVAVTSQIAWHFERVPQEEWKEIAAGF